MNKPTTKIILALAAAAAVALAAPAGAQQPGARDASKISGGTYKADPNHTQVAWSVDHFGFSTLFGMFGQITGTLELDPKNPAGARLDIKIPMSGLTVTSEKFSTHLRGNEFLDVEKFPEATFKSTSVEVLGEKARLKGDLTVHGVTQPVTLAASFHGAGENPMTKAETVGFSATGAVKRSDFGLGKFSPAVSDEVDLTIVGAFEK